ncbi:hypothetical protein G7Y89_g13884 [Cudoniella acicularis]|uniref:FAD-binding FR-type domain-containing protein n=1 Tax=Cudoniella acicularis TaxID=354080 RepID=A0A8H4R628_9HELO|nr:hypothetical protein G7Y89_g13884 [Cudoniella acicularis]
MSELEPIVDDQYTAARAYFACVIGLLLFESAIHLPIYFLELRNRGRPVVKSSPKHFTVTTYLHKLTTLPSFVPFLTNHHIPDLIRFLVFAGLNLLWGWNSIDYSTQYKLYGWLCIANGGLALLMASRTNLFAIILRIPSPTLLMYHRWIGLATVAHATTHFALNTQHDILTDQLADAFSSTRIQVGMMAWLSLAILFVTSLNFIRRRWFEAFYYSHALFFVFVVGALIHTTNGPEFLLPGLGLWAVDRAIRFWNNFRHYEVKEVIPYVGDVVKFKVEGVQVSHPGQIAWVQIPSISFLNWHPFTIASAPGDKEVVLAIRGLGGYTRKVQLLPDNTTSAPGDSKQEVTTSVKTGVKIRMDGPYGVGGVRWGLHPVTVLVAGGIGITPGISIATHIVKRGLLAKGGQNHWHIHLLWVVKERAHMKWFADELRRLAEILSDPSVPVTLDVTIHVTGGDTMRSESLGSAESYEMETPHVYDGPGVVVQGRPNLEDWFGKVKTMRSGLDSVVNACGPRPLINQVRRAASKNSWQGCHFRVEEEVFELRLLPVPRLAQRPLDIDSEPRGWIRVQCREADLAHKMPQAPGPNQHGSTDLKSLNSYFLIDFHSNPLYNMTKPIEVWMTAPGPNSWKVVMVLEELGIPYKIQSVRFEDIKKMPFIGLNPNGRAPAIKDPNTDLTLWESGAIVQYLVQQYDREEKLTCNSMQDKQLLNQWLMFQMSGQGPYFGQCGWFNVLHSEKLPSAIERYNAELHRILGVLEGALKGKDWLVGNKFTYADLVFAPWNDRIDTIMGYPPAPPEENPIRKFPAVDDWHKRIVSRPTWKKCMEIRDRLMDEQGLMPNGMPKGISNMEQYEAKIKAEEAAKAA